MQSSLLDERLAGNHRESVLARMAAEAGIADKLLDDAFLNDPGNECSPPPIDWSAIGLEKYGLEEGGYKVCYEKSTGILKLVSMGLYGAESRQAEQVIVAELREASGSVFDTAVVGCEGITVSGGSRIGSYDSTSPGKAWNESDPGDNAGLKTLGGRSDIVLGDNARIYGDVVSNGSVFFGKKKQGSSSVVTGDVIAGGNIEINGDSSVRGDVYSAGKVDFNGSGEIFGNLSANRDVNFEEYASSVDGNIQAGGKVKSKKRKAADHVGGDITENSNPDNSSAPVAGECDVLNIVETMQEYTDVEDSGPLTAGVYPYADWIITPDGVSYFNETWDVQKRERDSSRRMEVVEVGGRNMSMLRTGDFNLVNSSLTISGGDVAIFVDGDLNLGTGGGRGLIIEDGSTLTFFVTGSTKIASTIQMNAERSVNAEGHAVFSIYSSKEDKKEEAGVIINGGSNVVANVYAPLANVSVNSGGGVFGALRGKTLDIYGDGTIAYDEALGLINANGGSESDSAPEFISWGDSFGEY